MRKVVLIVLMLFTLATVNLVAEDFHRGLGFTAGHISGVGFAYRQYFDKNGLQFTVGMLSDRDNTPKFPDTLYKKDSITKTGWEVDGWVSAMFLRTLRESEFVRFYWFVGGSMKIDYTKKYTQAYVEPESGHYYEISGEPVKKRHNNNDFFFGPGVGLDYQLSKNISLIIELPLSISSDKKIETYIPQGGIIVRF